MATEHLVHNAQAAIDFLSRFHPGRGWNLSAIKLDRKGIETRTFRAGQDAELAVWLGIHAEDNIYYGVPELVGDVGKKASKDDVARCHYLHVDCDPRVPTLIDGEAPEKERQRMDAFNASERTRILNALRGFTPPPTVIVFSGGGYQAFWKLKTPVEVAGDPQKWGEVEAYNRAIELALEGDSCHSIDHVMRLPGSVNWPNAKKAKKGRVPARSEVVEWHSEREYEQAAFKRASPKGESHRGATTLDEPVRPRTLSSLDELTLDARLREIIETGRCAVESPKKKDDSRSAWLFDAVCCMIRLGVDKDTVVGILLDSRYRISDSVLDKGRRAKQYAIDQYRRASEKGEGPQAGEDGSVPDTVENIRKSVSKMEVSLEFDEFRSVVNVAGLPGFGPVMDDAALNRMRLKAEAEHMLRTSKDRYADVLLDLARNYPRHPVKEYLDSLEWDGVSRIDTWLVSYMGVKDSRYVRAIGRIVLVAAVRRIRHPGCKFDEMLILEGTQGSMKSSALATLACKDEWFSDDIPLGHETKELMESTSGKWIIEAADLHKMNRSDIEILKAYLSRTVDRARMAYGRLSTEVPRHFVIIGTTNRDRYLKDDTGARRYWPVCTGDVDLDELKRDRDQLWAEANAREAAGESIRLGRDLYIEAAREQESRRIEDPFLHKLQDVLGDKEGILSASEAWTVVGVLPGQRTQAHNERLGSAMRELGWIRVKKRPSPKEPPKWCYVRGNGPIFVVTLDHQGSAKLVERSEVAF